jgi:malonyl CoA-acyl carrier protein transacylase
VQEQQMINKVKIIGYSLGLVAVVAVAAWKLLVP